jgi:predicted nucleic acid-binding protein
MQTRFVVDNSVVMAWCFRDQADSYADAVLGSLIAAEACVPSIWSLEVVNALLTAERKKLIRQADSVRFLSLLSQLPISVENENLENAMKELLGLARAHRLSSYDAAYLDLAMRKGLPLATLDNKLRQSASSAHVPLWTA